MRDDEFEWDDAKAASNFKKLAVTFDTAREAFDEPHWVESTTSTRTSNVSYAFASIRGRSML